MTILFESSEARPPARIELAQRILTPSSIIRMVRSPVIMVAIGVIRFVASSIDVSAVVVVTAGVSVAPVEIASRLEVAAGIVVAVVVVGAANK